MDENNVKPELSERQIRKQGAIETGKDITEIGAKAAGTALGGPIGSQAVDLALNTKAGQKLVNKAGKTIATKTIPPIKKALENQRVQNAVHRTKPIANQLVGSLGSGANGSIGKNMAPNANTSSVNSGSSIGNMLGGKSKKGLFKSLFSGSSIGDGTAKAELNDGTPGEFSAGADVMKLITKLFGPLIAGFVSSGGCMIALLIILTSAIMMTPIMYANDVIDKVESFGEKLKNFLLGDGWNSDEEAAEKAMDDFYETVDEVYRDYLKNYKVEIDYDLLVATLTWYAPPSTADMEIDELVPTDAKFFKKSSKRVRELAKQMVTCEYETDPETGESGDRICFLDLEKYRKYLEDGFIRKFYFENKNTPTVDKQIPVTIDDIFNRATYFKYLNGNYSKSKKVYASCDNGITLNNNGTIENVSLDQYVAGLVCPGGNCNGMSEDEIKLQSVLVRTQVLNESSNCSTEVINNSFVANTDENILNIIKQTNNQIVISNGDIYDVDSIDQDKLKELLEQGLSYEDIIKELFDEDTSVSDMVVIEGQYNSDAPMIQSLAQLKQTADKYKNKGKVELAGETIDLSMLYSSGSGLISQCPWFAKSRALELIYESDMPDEQKLKAFKTIAGAMGNGTDWYSGITALNNFTKSSKYDEPRVGALVSWSSNSSKAGHSYGHVAIIEEVDYVNKKVLISESYNSGGVNAANNWNNVSYRLREFTFEELKNYKNYKNGGYSLNGYVYILG